MIFLAQWNPGLGATGGILRPEIFISKLGVFLIFFINGIALSLTSSQDNVQVMVKTNTLIQLFNYGFIPLLAKLLVPYYPEKVFRYVCEIFLSLM